MKPREYPMPMLMMTALSAACQSPPPAPAAADGGPVLPVAVGSYVGEGDACGNPDALFRYDGRSIGWSGGRSAPAAMYPIQRLRAEQGRWVVTIFAPGPGVSGGSAPRELDVLIVPRGTGRITVTAMERVEMTLCSRSDLPEWARQ